MVTWTTAGTEVYSREFDALGNPITAGNIHVTTLLNDQFGGVVTMADNNDYIVAFSGEGPGDLNGVFAQRYHVPQLPVIDLNGAPAGVDHTASFVEDGGAVGNGYAFSTNGGLSWRREPLLDITQRFGGGPFERATDPVVAFDLEDRIYLNSLAFSFLEMFRHSLQLLPGGHNRASYSTQNSRKKQVTRQ